MDWNLLIEILMFSVIAVITVVIVPWLKQRIGADRLAQMWKWVCMAVEAAEQLFGSGAGAEKKAYVLDFLARKGYAQTQEVDVMIESAVRELTD